jgi:hypothetical protein
MSSKGSEMKKTDYVGNVLFRHARTNAPLTLHFYDKAMMDRFIAEWGEDWILDHVFEY